MIEEDPVLLARPDKIEPINVFGTKFHVNYVYSVSQDIGKAYALTSVFQSEVFAILACSKNCRNPQLRDQTIGIWSDSRASRMALSSYTITSPQVSQCWNSIQELSTLNIVMLYWVSGYWTVPADINLGCSAKYERLLNSGCRQSKQCLEKPRWSVTTSISTTSNYVCLETALGLWSHW
jgi:hypothetical protein